jgi:hypothetical protein
VDTESGRYVSTIWICSLVSFPRVVTRPMNTAKGDAWRLLQRPIGKTVRRRLSSVFGGLLCVAVSRYGYQNETDPLVTEPGDAHSLIQSDMIPVRLGWSGE